MKSKINSILLILVAALWSTVIYKYVKQFLYPNEIGVHQAHKYQSKSNIFKQKKEFKIISLSRDPFLNTIKNDDKPKNSYPIKKHQIKTKTEPKPKIIENTIPFPSITYLGYIKSLNQNNELILIKVNGILQKYHSNEIKNGLKVKITTKDSISVTYMNTTKKYKLKPN